MWGKRGRGRRLTFIKNIGAKGLGDVMNMLLYGQLQFGKKMCLRSKRIDRIIDLNVVI